MEFPKKLQEKIEGRIKMNALRQLGTGNGRIDFSSNDYLGFSKNETIFKHAYDLLLKHDLKRNGATGSRLLSGNHTLYEIVEPALADFHKNEAALIFNSGYDANIGFFSSVPQRGDLILYDEYVHASIRDGITMNNAKAHKFRHNDLESLDAMLERLEYNIVYVVTESVFSMDGDTPDLKRMTDLCKKHKAFLVVDEAHAVGVFGKHGEGLVQELGLEKEVFARIVTFGKALGGHGAAVIGSHALRQYLINFSRSFIYTTALPPHSLATIHSAYNELLLTHNINRLHQNIQFFKEELVTVGLKNSFIDSHSAIHCCIISGNERVKMIAQKLQEHHFDVKPILSPTVPKGEERLRFCLHAYNSQEEISAVLKLLTTFVK